MPTAQPRGSPTVSLRRQSHHLTVTIKRDLRYRARGDGDTGHVAYSVTVEKATCPRDVAVRGNINNRTLGHSVQRPTDHRRAQNKAQHHHEQPAQRGARRQTTASRVIRPKFVPTEIDSIAGLTKSRQPGRSPLRSRRSSTIIRTGTCRNLGSVATSGFKDALVLSKPFGSFLARSRGSFSRQPTSSV
jgi:hypothetical protein